MEVGDLEPVEFRTLSCKEVWEQSQHSAGSETVPAVLQGELFRSFVW